MTADPRSPEPPTTLRRPRLPGWSRRGLLAVCVPLLMLGLGRAWQAIDLARIPDVGDPFDVAAFVRDLPDDVPDDRNAYSYYKRAIAALPMSPDKLREGVAPAEDWRYASDEWKARAADCATALDLWRQGTEQEEAVPHRPVELTALVTIDASAQLLLTFPTLALLEGSRREADGDMTSAWIWYRALLRSSRHTGAHGFLSERWFGATIHEQAASRIRRWAADDRVTAGPLRNALDEVRAIEAATPSAVDSARLDYLADLRTCDDPAGLLHTIEVFRLGGRPRPSTAWGQSLSQIGPERLMDRARVITGYEAERSRRVLRLLWANRLPQLGRPPADRALMAIDEPLIYAPDPTVPAAANALPPDELARRYRGSVWGLLAPDPRGKWLDRIDAEREDRNRLIADLEAELARRGGGRDDRLGDAP